MGVSVVAVKIPLADNADPRSIVGEIQEEGESLVAKTPSVVKENRMLVIENNPEFVLNEPREKTVPEV